MAGWWIEALAYDVFDRITAGHSRESVREFYSANVVSVELAIEGPSGRLVAERRDVADFTPAEIDEVFRVAADRAGLNEPYRPEIQA